MDELLHHCLRELSFDGDLGCNVSRLRDFVVGFYSQSGVPHTQNPDDAFCAFVWSLIVQQPTVLVGTISLGDSSDIWVAPQTSAKRKARARGEDHVDTIPPKLDPVPAAKDTALDELQRLHGDRLRIAVEPDAIFAAITGSHIRSSKTSPMVYSALQIITQGRDNGVTVVELGRKSKYDQKTCFYLVRQLTELDLVVKVRRGGVGTHFCIHKYFFDRNPSWKAIRDEETLAEDLQKNGNDTAVLDEEEAGVNATALKFTPIDARHLSSLPLISARVVKLLKASKNFIHASNNMLITLGFSNPTKTDRRFFQSRIREMIQQRLIEKVVVPSNRKKSVNASVKCFRLVTTGDLENHGAVVDEDDEDDPLLDGQNGIKMNITIHKQIIDLIEESGITGMTLNELSAALCNFDKRTIELLLARAEKYHPPPHLSDLGIAALMETSGRERRHRYYTVACYRKLVSNEQLDKSSAGYGDVDLRTVGGFYAFDTKIFYESESELFNYQDSFKDEKTRSRNPVRRPPKNPILPDGSVKQGRPRKHPIEVEPGSTANGQQTSRKRKAAQLSHPDPLENDDVIRETANKRRRLISNQANDSKDETSPVQPKRRGRPPKLKVDTVTIAEKGQRRGRPPKRKKSVEPDVETSVKKRRGRPPKATRDAQRHRSPDTADDPVEAIDRLQINLEDPNKPSLPELVATTPETHPFELNLEPHREKMTPIFTVPSNVESFCGINPHQLDNCTQEPLSGDSINGTLDGSNISHITSTSLALPDLGRRVLTVEADVLTSASYAPSNADKAGEASLGQASEALAGAVSTGSSKEKSSSASRSRVNVSHLRRENELYRVVEDFGGIINIQTKEFFEAHMNLLETLSKAGEPTSAPIGTRTDKRTATATFNSLEMKGRVKQLRTSVTTHTGVNRPACIVYLPHIDHGKLNAFLADLARGTQPTPPQLGTFVKFDQPVEYGADPSSTIRNALPLQLLQMEQPGDSKERWSKNVARASQLFTYDDSTIREVLLAERTTLGQLYGFIVGKIIRARELHLSVLSAFETGSPCRNVISCEGRIIDLAFFCHDLPLSLYTSLVSSLSHDDELTAFFGTEEGRQTPVRDLPQHLHSILQIGRSRARSRFLDILETLRCLQLVTPLQLSTASVPWITCPPNGDHPTKFDPASLDGWTINTPMSAPAYWYFSDLAPIHLWAVSETQPPFWKDTSVGTAADGLNYWESLREACINPLIPVNANVSSKLDPLNPSISVARSLRRTVSWNPDYILTWHQMQYLKRFIDVASGKTPLQEDEDTSTSQIERICRVISAPRSTIENYFRASRVKLLGDLERMRRKVKERKTEKRSRRAAETKVSLARKAEEARLNREQEWNMLLLRVHPDALGPATVRVDRVRNRFLQTGSTKDIEKWEKQINDAVREAGVVAMKTLKTSAKRNSTDKHILPMILRDSHPQVIEVPCPSIKTLIEQQGPPILHQKEGAKRKRKSSAINEDPRAPDAQKKSTRRHRFQWSRDYDELARDASAIIRARCRGLPRLDWAAFEQVFPAVPRNTVRQRLSHIKETPGNEAYLRRLEERWYDLWIKHRGTSILPDEYLESTSNFNLVKHVEFLRAHVDKNALRVGLAEPKEKAGILVPLSIERLLDEFEVVETTPAAPSWDFVWNAAVEEGREKRLLRQPFTREPGEFPPRSMCEEEDIFLAESTLKMAMGTPPERYDSESASLLLRSAGEDAVATAIKNLLGKGVLSKSQRDPTKQKPGRQLKISESNQNAIGGVISCDTYQDAASLVEAVTTNVVTWREWPLTATDGDCAALIQLVSENQVDFKVDTSQPRAARPMLDWNSKKADDDQIETAIYVQCSASGSNQQLALESLEPLTTPEAGSHDQGESEIHGTTITGGDASCRRMLRSGIVDCVNCLNNAWATFRATLTGQEQEIAHQVLCMIRQAGERGISKADIASSGGSMNEHLFLQLTHRMAELETPLLYWVGYSSIVIVCARFVGKWSAMTSLQPVTKTFPRRWLDIVGLRVADFWQSALRAVMGLVIFRPGISQAELRWRLRSVYDRQEINEILRYLRVEGHLCVRQQFMSEWDQVGVMVPLDDQEERTASWVIGEKAWYQV